MDTAGIKRVAVGVFAFIGVTCTAVRTSNCVRSGARVTQSVKHAVRTTRGVDAATDTIRAAAITEKNALEHAKDVTEAVRDGGELVELISVAIDSDDSRPPAAVVRGTLRPQYIELESDAWAWQRLVEGDTGGGKPFLFVGPGGDHAMIIDGRSVPLTELAASCWAAGTACMFVACDMGCGDLTRASYLRTSPGQHLTVETFAGAFVATRMRMSGPAPKFIAIVDGDEAPRLRIVQPKLVAGG